jgi:hypothetical protein
MADRGLLAAGVGRRRGELGRATPAAPPAPARADETSSTCARWQRPMIAKLLLSRRLCARMARISYAKKKVFAIMAMGWVARCDPTPRERAKASRVPVARRNCPMIGKIPYSEGYAPCIRKNLRPGLISRHGWRRFLGVAAHSPAMTDRSQDLSTFINANLPGIMTTISAPGLQPRIAAELPALGASGALAESQAPAPAVQTGRGRPAVRIGVALRRVAHSGRSFRPVPDGRSGRSAEPENPPDGTGRRAWKAGRRGLGALNGHGM